ncbi:hypothetical protein CC80DRAFT_460982 [Byssothecium circinans]|uniref:Gfd2/YDR514C-like C-terminal domain-containing protein n=1 Tax=Byssothecium circinans TaxID=147558 RepID=A0A6A5UFI9_9PLEO|nr:hypothetical protein CC80DRAFT_460982 [Byssothecium circinans]
MLILLSQDRPTLTMSMKSTRQRLVALRHIVGTSTPTTVLRSYLNGDPLKGLSKSQNALFKDAVLVTVYRKWLAFPPNSLLDIGITTFDRRKLDEGVDKYAGAHAENFFRHVWFLHLRIRERAHLPQGDADPDRFHFGSTVFTTQEEARGLLHDVWHQPVDEENAGLGNRPIIYISFGNNDGYATMRRDLDFDLSSANTTIAVMNAQSIAHQANITRSQDASIDYLLKPFKITPHDPANSGNAAAYITIIVFLSVLRMDLYHQIVENPKGKPGRYGQSKSKPARHVINALMLRPTPAPPFGHQTYCSACGSCEHIRPSCDDVFVACMRCARSKQSWRRENAESHLEELCAFP